MSTATITLLNFIVHSLVIGAAAWLLVRFVIRDALRRCILANLAVLMCLYCPFDISIRDLFPPQQPVPVWTPLRETFEADWRVTVTPVTTPVAMPAAPAPLPLCKFFKRGGWNGEHRKKPASDARRAVAVERANPRQRPGLRRRSLGITHKLGGGGVCTETR